MQLFRRSTHQRTTGLTPICFSSRCIRNRLADPMQEPMIKELRERLFLNQAKESYTAQAKQNRWQNKDRNTALVQQTGQYCIRGTQIWHRTGIVNYHHRENSHEKIERERDQKLTFGCPFKPIKYDVNKKNSSKVSIFHSNHWKHMNTWLAELTKLIRSSVFVCQNKTNCGKKNRRGDAENSDEDHSFMWLSYEAHVSFVLPKYYRCFEPPSRVQCLRMSVYLLPK